MNDSLLKVRLYGDPCLRKKSVRVKEVGPGERMLINSMIATMHHENGIGLAAAQVGINERLFVMDIGDGPLAVINPRVISKSGSEVMEEGCLSLPEFNVSVKRSSKILVKYVDENNQTVEKNLEGLMARVFLHETDHCEGKLIIDFASPEEKGKWIEKFEGMDNKPKNVPPDCQQSKTT